MRTDDEPRSEQGSEATVLAAVARESKRRRRVFRAYLALLIVPIIAAALALAYGESEREAIVPRVRAAVVPELREDLDRTVRAEVDTAFGERMEPIVASVVRDQSRTVNAELVRHQDLLDDRVATVSEEIAEVRRATAAVADLQPQLRRLQDLMERTDLVLERSEQTERRLEELLGEQRRVAETTAGNSGEIRRLHARVAELEGQLEALRKRDPR